MLCFIMKSYGKKNYVCDACLGVIASLSQGLIRIGVGLGLAWV